MRRGGRQGHGGGAGARRARGGRAGAGGRAAAARRPEAAAAGSRARTKRRAPAVGVPKMHREHAWRRRGSSSARYPHRGCWARSRERNRALKHGRRPPPCVDRAGSVRERPRSRQIGALRLPNSPWTDRWRAFRAWGRDQGSGFVGSGPAGRYVTRPDVHPRNRMADPGRVRASIRPSRGFERPEPSVDRRSQPSVSAMPGPPIGHCVLAMNVVPGLGVATSVAGTTGLSVRTLRAAPGAVAHRPRPRARRPSSWHCPSAGGGSGDRRRPAGAGR